MKPEVNETKVTKTSKNGRGLADFMQSHSENIDKAIKR